MQSNPLPLRFSIREENYLFRNKRPIRRTVDISSLFGRASKIASTICMSLPKEKRTKETLRTITFTARLMLRGSLTIPEIEERLTRLFSH